MEEWEERVSKQVMWLDDWERNGMRSRLVAQQFIWAKPDDVTQNTALLVAARLLFSKAASFGHKIGPEALCLALWRKRDFIETILVVIISS